MSSVTVEDIQALKPTDAMWTIGITAKSASVSEEATLRIMEFIPQSLKLSPEFLAALVLKAMVNPTAILEDSGADDGDELLPKVQRRPQVMSFLPTELIPHALIDAVAQKMEAYGVKITSYQQLKPEEMTEIIKKRRADILKEDKEMRQKLKEKAVSEKVEYQPQPLRGCFTCKTEITGKASQCSACKAIIYCSADCAVSVFKCIMERKNSQSCHTVYRKKTGRCINKCALPSKAT